MKIRKLNKVSLVLASAAVAMNAGTAHADKNAFKSFESMQSPFESCKDVKIISEDEYKSDGRWQKEVKDCNGKVQIAPSTGFTVTSMKDNAQALVLMDMVAQATKKRLESNIASMTKLRACFAGGGKDCSKTKSEAMTKMDAALDDFNRESIVSRELITGGKNALGRRSVLATQFGDMTDANFAKVSGKDSSLDKLSPEANKAIDAKLSMDRSSSKNASKKELIQLSQQHRAKASEILLSQMPLLSVLEKTKNFKDGKPVWTDAEIVKGFDKLIENAKTEIATTDKSIKEGKLEFSRFYETKKGPNGKEHSVPNVDRFWKSFVKGERDLLDYIMFTPMVDEVLKSRPDLCGTATGLSGHLSNKGMQNAGGILVGAVATLGVGGALGAAGLGAASGGAIAITGGQMAGLLGVGMGMANVAASFHEVDVAKRQVMTNSGAGDDTSGIQNFKKVEEAKKGAVLAIAMHPLDYFGSGAAGKAIYSGLKSGSISSKAAAALKGIEAGSAEETRIINSAINEVYFKGRTPAEAEKKLLAEINDVTEKKGVTDRMDRQVALASRLFDNPVKTPQEIAAVRAVKGMFGNLDPALMKEWDDAGFQGFQKVYGEVLADVRKMNPKQLAKYENDLNEQKRVLRNGLQKLGVKDKNELDSMVQCVLPTRAAK